MNNIRVVRKNEDVKMNDFGYKLIGAYSAVCGVSTTLTGIWGNQQPICEEIFCEVQNDLPNGGMVCTNNNRIGSDCK